VQLAVGLPAPESLVIGGIFQSQGHPADFTSLKDNLRPTKLPTALGFPR